MRKTVDKEFKNLIYKQYPGLYLDIAYSRFMRYLMFGKKDKNGNPILDQWHIAKAENKEYLVKQNNYFAEKFLIRFQENVIDIDSFYWTNWQYTKQEARVAIVNFPTHIDKAIEKERNKKITVDRVYFDTGRVFTKAQQKIDRELLKEEAYTYFDFCAPEARELFEYMNNLPTNSFSKVITNNIENTLLKAFQIEDPEKRRVQIEILNCIKDEIQPFYKPSIKGNTVRIFPLNYSIPMLRKDLRREITKGWYEFDLTSSQLAIVGSTWEIPEVQLFLKNGGKIWHSLLTHFEFDVDYLKGNEPEKYEDIKKVLKDSLYSLIYGMYKVNLVDFLDKGLLPFDIKDAGKKFFKHPLIATLFKAREKRILTLNNYDSVETISGKHISIGGFKTLKGKPDNLRKEDIRCVMAQQAQAIEMDLLLPVLKLAKSTTDFTMTLFMHDGFSISFNHEGRKERWISKINEVVENRAKDLGIITKLEWEFLE